MTAQHPPAGGAPRLIGVDATRGVALLGMIAVHSLYGSDTAGRATWSFAIFGGRAAATFAVLAGLGVAFMTGRRRVRLAAARGTVAALVVRALAVGAIGLALGYTNAALGTVILPYYAVLFLVSIPLVFLPTWAIAALGAVVVGGAPVLTHVVLPQLPARTLVNPTLHDLIHQPVRLLSQLLVTGEYPALPWTAYMCAGLVIGRLTLSKIRVTVGLIVTGLVLAFGASVTSSRLLHDWDGIGHIWAAQPGSALTAAKTAEMLTLGGDGTTPTSTWWWLAIDAPHTSTPLDLLGTIGAATALLGVMLLVTHLSWPVVRQVVAVIQTPLAATGGMTLTLYSAHIMFINSDFDTYSANTGYALQAVAVLLIGLGWRATAGRGPLESLVSALASRSRRWISRRDPPVKNIGRVPDLIVQPARGQPCVQTMLSDAAGQVR